MSLSTHALAASRKMGVYAKRLMIEALLSGDYVQTPGTLVRTQGRDSGSPAGACCLGVETLELIKNNVVTCKIDYLADHTLSFDGQTGLPPARVAIAAFDLTDDDGEPLTVESAASLPFHLDNLWSIHYPFTVPTDQDERWADAQSRVLPFAEMNDSLGFTFAQIADCVQYFK